MNDEKYKLILENLISGIAVFEFSVEKDDFIITEFNKAACRIENIAQEDVVGNYLGNVSFRGNKAGLIHAVERVYLDGQPEKYSVKEFQNEKISAWINHSLFKISTGEVVSVFNDETKRKVTEQTLKEREQRLSAITHASPLGICLVRNRRFEWVNDTLCSLTGYDSESLIGKNARLFYNDDKEYERIGRLVYSESKKAQLVTAMTRWVRKDGSILNCSIRKSPMDVDDFSSGFIVAVADISERIRFEKDKARLEELLLHAQKMEALGILAGGIAHDFNNILFPIMGYTELMMMDAHDEKTLGYLSGISNAVNRSKELVEQILSFTRKRTDHEETMKIQPLINEVVKLLKATFPANITITHKIDRDCGAIFADPAQIHQVVMNLCTNAFHAMEYRGGRLTLCLEQIELGREDVEAICTLEPGSYLMLEVRDSGEGMAPGVVKRIFEPYFTTKNPGKGTGIGLSIVHAIIKKSKGEIKVESEPGVGTVFKIYLPVVSVERKIQENKVSLPPLDLMMGKGNVLLIDDEKEIVLLLKEMLTKQGYHVTPCVGSLEAFNLFTENPFRFDLVITDLTMPEMTGIELAEEFNAINPDIPIIICTGFCENILTKMLKRKGIIRETIKKPILLNELMATINRIINEEKNAGKRSTLEVLKNI